MADNFKRLLGEGASGDDEVAEKAFNDAIAKLHKSHKFIKALPKLNFEYVTSFSGRGETGHKFKAEAPIPPMLVSLFEKLYIEATVYEINKEGTKYTVRMDWSYTQPGGGSNGKELLTFWIMDDGDVKTR